MCEIEVHDRNICVEMRGIEKSFHGNKVCNGVNLTLKRQEIHALLGENGAGKTTLMNILYGLYKAESGEIYLDGECVHIDNPQTAIGYGVGMVHQHFALVDTLTAYENIVLGLEETSFGFIRKNESLKKIQNIIDECGLHVNLDARVSTLPIGVRQRIEILKVLFRNARIIILDEPTAVLTPQEADELIVILKRLRDKGASIILITHKMRETFAASDRVTVMRKGEIVETVETSKTSFEDLAMSMIGRRMTKAQRERDKRIESMEDPLLVVRDLSTLVKHSVNLREISFDISSGQILGVAGVDGNGQSQLVDALVGVVRASHGQIFLGGEEITHMRTDQRMLKGIALVPEDRNQMGLVSDFTAKENLFLGKQRTEAFSRRGFLRMKRIREMAEDMMDNYDVSPPDHEILARQFSGGNQQKIIIAREFSNEDIQIIIAVQPTRGLDIAATEFVHQQLEQMRNEGKAILLISTELDEVRALSDQIAVIYEGQLLAKKDSCLYSKQELGLLMAGKRYEDA